MIINLHASGVMIGVLLVNELPTSLSTPHLRGHMTRAEFVSLNVLHHVNHPLFREACLSTTALSE